MSVATTANYSNLASYIQTTGLKVAEPLLVFGKYGQKETIPTRKSKTWKARRFEKFQSAATAGATAATVRSIVEGATPSDTNTTVTDISLTLSQYGLLTRYSDIAEWTDEVSVSQNLMARNSEDMAETTDRVYRDGILGGTNVFRLTDGVGGVSGAARVNVAGRCNSVAFDKVIRNLERQVAKYWSDKISAGKNIGTQGILPAYIVIVHPDQKYDIQNMPGFVPSTAYGTDSGVEEGEFGAYKNLRFIVTTQARVFPDAGAAAAGTVSTTGANSDVYIAMVIAKDAYAVVDLASSAEITYIPASQKDHANPLGQWTSLGWKAMCGSVILNDNWILRVETVASVQ